MERKVTQWSKEEISELFKKSKNVYSDKNFSIHLSKSNFDSGKLLPGKLLVITPKKSGNAPERNLFRRRVKAIFFEEKLCEKQQDWIFIAKSNISKVTFEKLQTTVLRVLQKF